MTYLEVPVVRVVVLSSAAFKTIRRTTRERDFKPNFGNVEGAKLIDKETDEETLVLKVPCDYVGDADDDKTRGAVLFGHKSDDEILARCVSQCEGDPIYVDDCLTGVDDKSGAMDENEVNVLEIQTSSGGE
ncbi:hypothetical protein ACFR99_01615 [Haloarchaeobius amylolyticus]|uniref:Uncharacterized protein n=1 Tax=Haloarchaeobius amylolyticus TaxID=1198296 RepID=A0ABD6BBY3_9EURY